MFTQQLGGINGVCFYVRDIFESAGIKICPSNFIISITEPSNFIISITKQVSYLLLVLILISLISMKFQVSPLILVL